MNTDLYIAVFFGVIAMISGGLTDVFAKKFIDRAGELKALLYIRLIGACILLILLFVEPVAPENLLKNILFSFLFALADFVASFLVYKAYKVGKVSIVGSIVAPYALFSAFISFFVFHEEFTIWKVIGILVSLLGIFLTAINFRELKDGFQLRDLAKGLGFVIVSFFLWGAYSPFFDKFIEQDGWVLLTSMVDIHFIIITFLAIRASGMKLEKRDLQDPKWFLVSGLMLGIMAISYTLGFRFSTQTSIMVSISSAYPLAMLIGGRFILNEKLEKIQYIGIFVIILGILIMGLLA